MPSRITLAAAPALIAPLIALALALPAAAGGAVISAAQPPAEAWSPAEMRTAEAAGDGTTSAGTAAPLLRRGAASATPSAAKPLGAREVDAERQPPFSAHGRLFFQKAGEPEALYSCSGTVVRSQQQNLVFTAGHCVYDLDKERFNERLTFVPAYRDGEAPFGQFAAKVRYTTTGWISGSGVGHDIGAISLAEPVQHQVGARPVNFHYSPAANSHVSIFGYPAKPSPTYDGQRPIVCDAAIVLGINTGNPPSLAASPCDMQQGSSGGGWINPAGQLFSVVSHGYCDSDPRVCGFIFGPRLGNAGIQIYKRAGGSERLRLTIVQGPSGRHRSSRARFAFRAVASTPVVYECRITGPGFRGQRARFRLCGRTRVFRRLKPGRYQLRVRATDQTGRRAQQSRIFRVVR